MAILDLSSFQLAKRDLSELHELRWTALPSLLRQSGDLLGGYGWRGQQLREAMSAEAVARAFCEQYFVCWLVSSSGHMKLLSLKRSQQSGSTDLTEH